MYTDGGVRITDDKLPLLNRTADLGSGRHLKPVEDGKGGYHALIEVFHQLHCLVWTTLVLLKSVLRVLTVG